MKILVLDTETLGLNDRRVYDLGYVIYDTEAKKVCVMRDYIIKQVYDNPRLMATAYYGNKRPIYEERLHTRYCKKVWWGTACRILAKDIKKFKVDALFAYNSRFDYRAILTTCEKYGAKVNPTAEGIDDIMRYIANITETEDYKGFCKAHGFMTKHKKPRCQKKAETLFRYLTGKVDYQEEHTALEDSKIELQIYLTALQRA